MRKFDTIDLLVSICFLLAISAGAVIMYWDELHRPKPEIHFSTGMSLKELAKANNAPVKEILHQLSHKDRGAWDLPWMAPISTLSVDPQEVHHAIEHIAEESVPGCDLFKFVLWSAYLMISLGILMKVKKIDRLRLSLRCSG